MFHKVKSVTPLPGLQLLVHFVNGCAKRYDMSTLLDRLPGLRSLVEHGQFDFVQVDTGGYGISWNDDVDLSCEELWEHGAPIVTPFDRLLSFADATEQWGLSESTLRKAVMYRKLVEGLDVQKYGKQWIVTLDAMHREYGAPKSKGEGGAL